MPNLSAILSSYLDELQAVRANPQATPELSLRDALTQVLSATRSFFGSSVEFIGEGKKISSGRPDYTLTRSGLPTGYIEAEKYGADLAQLKGHARSQNSYFVADLDNFLLTNHLDFRLFANGKMQAQVVLPERAAQLEDSHLRAWEALFAQLLAGEIQPVKNPSDLARILARRAQVLQRAVQEDLKDKGSYSNASLHEFKTQLLPNILPSEFADLYAQTLTYGLFAARCLVAEASEFSVEGAAKRLRAIPLLASLFREFEFHLSHNLEWVLSEIASVLKKAPIEGVREYFQKRSGRADPMIDFYEPFLSAYDPGERELRGVYYTPEPVVSYIVRSVDKLLARDLKRELGLADNSVKILDPATGTGSFLFAVLDEIHKTMQPYGSWADDVHAHILPRLSGLELMMAPYAIAHLKLSLQLDAWGTPPRSRIRIFLSNTLDDVRTSARGKFELGREVEQADSIKASEQVLVVLGNPPYSGHSANLNFKMVGGKKELTAVGKRVESYKTVDGAGLGERNSKWLQDDYVKFIAFAQNRITQTGEGIVGYITNHGYLDNPTFRGLRASLLDSFDEIYVLDLHGNAKKKEVAPPEVGDGSGKDDNVFDIQQGVAIILAVKKRREPGEPKPRATVFHASLWGRRAHKYAELNASDVTSTAWQVLAPSAPHYLFVPRDDDAAKKYEELMKITDIMPTNNVGLVTARDSLTIQFSPDAVWETVQKFVSLDEAAARSQFTLGPDARDWKVSLAQSDVRASGPAKEKVFPILYRPFDSRFTYYTGKSRGFICMPRNGLMRNMLRDNIGLITARSNKSPTPDHVFCSKAMTEAKTGESTTQSALFPLYLYDEEKKASATATATISGFNFQAAGLGKRPNLSPLFIKAMGEALSLPIADGLPQGVSPEDIFGYIYAILHSPTYRSRYAAFLKTDFPRVPFPLSLDQFRALSALGSQLVALHTLDAQSAPVLNEMRFAPVGTGSNTVERVQYDEPSGILKFNATRGFGSVAREVWEWKIGGYQVAKKWLDDRKNRTLGFDEMRHFQRTLIALDETRRVMAEINAIPFV